MPASVEDVLQQLAEAERSNAKKEDAMKERYLRIGVSAS